jgi:hypothetical protein
MAKWRQSGQTLVELAVVLPCFCLGIFMAVQLMCYCHNMIELQRMAQLAIDRVSYDNYQSGKTYSLFDSLWGRTSFSRPPPLSDMPRPWRPFRGISTIREPGHFFHVHLDSVLMPGDGFSRVLPGVTQKSYAENFIEPPVPPEE